MKVISSHVADVDLEDGTLVVTFANGARYAYDGAGEAEYAMLTTAPRVGMALVQVKQTFPARKL